MWWLFSSALADCPDPAERTAAALTAYDLAETETAMQALAEGLASLGCQTRVLRTEELLELYRVSALVALTVDDREGVVYATIRAVAADHERGQPPAKYGPELAAHFETWAARLGAALVTVRVDGGGTVYVDGRPADAMTPLPVVQGEHVLQIDAGDGSPVRTEVKELSTDVILSTGIPFLAPPVPDPVPVPDPLPVPAPEPVSAHRRRPLVLWLGTAATAGGAAFLISSGYLSELNFLRSPYASPDFYGCDRTDACYPLAREKAIRTDAERIRAAYGIGYGLSAVSGGLLVVTVVGLPPRR